mgnify:CR=1 FL=1
MVEKLSLREKEVEAGQVHVYETMMREVKARNERLAKGRKVVSGKSLPFQIGRQGTIRHYLSDSIKDTAVDKWSIFVHEIKTHSGKHRHQGGLNIFVLKGKGYTTVDGVRHDWDAGDLICLPVKKGGVEHQHFNLEGKPSRWLAFINNHIIEMLGRFVEQRETSPDWKGQG